MLGAGLMAPPRSAVAWVLRRLAAGPAGIRVAHCVASFCLELLRALSGM